MAFVSKVVSIAMGNRIELSPGMLTDEYSAEQIGAAFDTALIALAKVGIYPTRIERADADIDADTEASPIDVTRARRIERNVIAADLMAWAELEQGLEHYGPAAALAIASNMVRSGRSPR